MEFMNTKNGFFLTLPKDKKLNESLAQFMVDQNIQSAFFHGLGALKDAELGFYHLHKKEYQRQTFADEAELINLTGNMSWHEGKPVVHSHAALGNDKFEAYGGHLFEARVAVTVEIVITIFDQRVERKFDPNIGLNLLSFCPIQ
jgi:predicted DNA-binding protein with PD1-like motif